MPKPNQVPKLQFPTMDPVFQQHYQQVIDTLNTLAGYNGTVKLANHLDLGGNKVMNVGAPENPTDAISSGHAESKYSAKALRPHLEAGGAVSLRTYITQLKGDVTGQGPGSAQTTIQSITGVTLNEISGNLALTQLPTAGVSVTIPLAKLTVGGTDGSMTFQHGLLTGYVLPT